MSENGEKKDYTPSWFVKWRNNDFRHLKDQVSFNTKLLMIVIGTILAFALAIIVEKCI